MAVNSFNAQNPPVTTKGDLFTFSTIPTRLGVGANDTVLTADSAAATGLKWGGTWQTWSPTVTGFTLGSGATTTYRYQQIGKTVFGYVRIVLGTGGTVSAQYPRFTLPITPAQAIVLGQVYLIDSGTASYTGVLGQFDTTTYYFATQDSSGTYVKDIPVNTTIPFTPGVNDSFTAVFWYEV